MSFASLTISQLFEKYGKSMPAPNIGQRVLIERGGKTDEAAFALGEVVSSGVGSGKGEGRIVVKETHVYFDDGRVTTPHRSPVILPADHFAKPIRERLRERAARLSLAAQKYGQWAELPV